MEISDSNDWHRVYASLMKKSSNLKHKRDICKMIDNLSLSVTELSKAEVDARRGKPKRATELRAKINEEINTVEEYLLVASLIG